MTIDGVLPQVREEQYAEATEYALPVARSRYTRKICIDGTVVYATTIEYLTVGIGSSIVEFEGKLAVIIENSHNFYNIEHGCYNYFIDSRSLGSAVAEIITNPDSLSQASRTSIKYILLHKDFKQYLDAILEEAFSYNESGILKLCTYSPQIVLDILQVASDIGQFNPLEMDPYHRLWLQIIIMAAKPDEQFRKDFEALSEEQRNALYQLAFDHTNPFIHEPADTLILPEQYSINFMWINKQSIPDDQEFLFGDGLSPKDVEQDFHHKFVWPISKWVKKNPGSPINIWVDGKFATSQAIERSKEALLQVLPETLHHQVHFRDVRSIPLVHKNPKPFEAMRSETLTMPLYYRIDLLRAIASDHILSHKETQFAIYCDLDMKPLSKQELFDKRTVKFLNHYGCVFAKGGGEGFENGFFILNGYHSQFMESHRKIVISKSIQRGKPGFFMYRGSDHLSDQDVYYAYANLLSHLLSQEGADPGYHFRGALLIKEQKIHPFEIIHKCVGPLKPVRLPPSHLNSSTYCLRGTYRGTFYGKVDPYTFQYLPKKLQE